MRGTPFMETGWVGGLNTIDSPYTLEDSESRDCLNVTATTKGAIRKRTGSQSLVQSTLGEEWHTIVPVTVSGKKFLIAAGKGKIYAINPELVVEEIGKGFNETARWSIVQAPESSSISGQGPVYLTNGVDKPQYWSGSGEVKNWTGIASKPKPTDGEATEKSTIFKSATAGFVSTDVGLTITFTTAGVFPGNSASIVSVLNSKEVLLSQEATKTEAAVHFEIARSFYSTEPHVPNGKYMVFAGNRIWMTGISGDPTAVWFSELVSEGEKGAQADPSSWPSTNFVRFDGSDGNSITGIGIVGPYLCVFKERKTWIIHDLNSGANRRLADTIGCISHRSIVETAMGTFFLTADQGIYLTDGTHLKEMSYKVRPTILAINQSKRENAAGAYFNNHYYLSFASGESTTNNRTLDYDVELKSWWLHDLTGNQWAVWSPEGTTKLYAARTTGSVAEGPRGGITECFVSGVFSDLGKPYTGAKGLSAYWFGPWQVFYMFIFRHRIKTPHVKKRVRQIHFDGSGEIIPMVARNFAGLGTDQPATITNNPQSKPTMPASLTEGEQTFGEKGQEFGGAGNEAEGTLFGGAASVRDARLYSLGVARAWSVGFGNATNSSFEVDSFTYMIQFRKS